MNSQFAKHLKKHLPVNGLMAICLWGICPFGVVGVKS